MRPWTPRPSCPVSPGRRLTVAPLASSTMTQLLAQHLEGAVRPDPDGGVLVDADAQELGVLEDHRDQPVGALAGDEVLVDDDVAEEAEAAPQLDAARRG